MREQVQRWIGHVDRYDTFGVYGWAADRFDLNQSVLVEMVDENGQILGRCVADTLREDLAEGGLGNGKHAFYLPFNKRTKDMRRICVRFIGSHVVLQGGVIEMDVDAMILRAEMPRGYIDLMRSLAGEVLQMRNKTTPSPDL